MRTVNLKLLRAAIFVAMASSSLAEASGKLEFATGLMSNFASSNNRTGAETSLSGIGTYHVGYKREIFSNIEIDLGYSLSASKIISGDLAFGLDAGINYFPITSTDSIVFQDQNRFVSLSQHWRPYVGIGFHQRNFQSTSSQYAGWGLKLGVEKYHNSKMSWVGSIRYCNLLGPNQSSVSQTEIILGAIFNLW